jgi:hypothetical protein
VGTQSEVQWWPKDHSALALHQENERSFQPPL